MATRIRTLNFLPEIFKTPTNAQFLSATLDQLVAQPNTKRIEGYVGSKFGYGINATDKYVTEPTKVRTDYQLDPGVVFTKANDTTATDFISYPGILDALKLEGSLTNDNNRLFTSQFYSWDSFTDLDKIINFNQYYWLPFGPERVTITTDIVYNTNNYTVQDSSTGYLISSDSQPAGSINPTLTLLRGGSYTFAVNQETQFWIQGEPGVTGYSATQPNVQTRDVFGVVNNGATNGVVTFNVPQSNAQDEYNFPGNNLVGVVSTLPFSQVNGARVSDIAGIDGITALDGLTVMFYNTGIVNEYGYVSKFYDTTLYDENGGVPYDENTDYPGSSVDSNNFEGGFYSQVNANFYYITLVGEPTDPTIELTPYAPIPTNQKITAQYGSEWVNRNFYRNVAGAIQLIGYNSSILDTLYYQDGTSANKVGIIKLVDSNTSNQLDIITTILGKKQYTSPTGVVFTNGLKVVFQGDIFPESYKNVEFYVEGVGTAIELIPVDSLISPGLFEAGSYIPYDTTNYDIGNYDSNLYVPLTPDYITIARNAINKNAWSRSNRWFHIDVIKATAEYNNDPTLVTSWATLENKAKRPIIEFYPNIRMFDAGVYGKAPIDFIDFRTSDAFTLVAGQTEYYPDVAGWTDYTATINPITGPITDRVATQAVSLVNQIILDDTSGLYVNDTISFDSSIGGLTSGATYYILSIDGFRITVSGTRQGTVVALTSETPVSPITTSIYPYTTTIEVDNADIFGLFQEGFYITDNTNLLPTNAQITDVSATTSTTTITVSWTQSNVTIGSTSVASLVTADTTVDNYALFDGARIVFAADTDPEVRNKIYNVHFSEVVDNSTLVITLTEADDGLVLPDEQTAVFRGYNYQGKDFYFDGVDWFEGQQKITVNQAPKFDIFDANGVSFGDETVYVGTSFTGTTLFSYGLGIGADDPVLGFPLRYSSVDNVGDISFDVSLNSQTFDYVSGQSPITQNINTGYVYNYNTRIDYVRQLGWQTAVSPSIQYQIFEFDWFTATPTSTFNCDIAPVSTTSTNWPVIQVYINNQYQDPATAFTYTTTDTTTTVSMTVDSLVDTVVQVLILSDQVSETAYYQVPINLNNNPFNDDVTNVNIGDIRGQYQSCFYNNPDTTGNVFGPNNYRDLGNMVPWGNKIIQNSASLVLPGALLRKQEHNLFNSLVYNSRQYITFKTLLVDTVNNTDYTRMYTPAQMLDDALDQITASKTDSDPFFWSDMVPSKAAYISNTYSFANSLDVSIYPLSRVYNFKTANYYSVLVYLIRDGVTTQLISGVDYTVSEDSPSLTVQTDLLPNDQITVKEYNQTYGSYVPNTPTKLGLYPATIPNVTLDSAYSTPTYFIVGHDGSYNKLYGNYDSNTGRLDDFRDQVLLEYETRVYNNLKLSNVIPVQAYEVLPGFFRDTDYSYDEILQIYGEGFLNWVGQNRIDYKRQIYNKNNDYTYNYSNNGNKINNGAIQQGYWRGLYEYYYDTSNPDTSPWEMLGYRNQPTWWETRYGPAPYTSDNLILWTDLSNGYDWNNGTPVTLSQYIRPELLQVIPVDSNGDLVSPFVSILGNYNANIFQRDWKVGDVGPAEFSYRRSSSWPFDLMRILALTKPAEFYNLGVDVDHYQYNAEFNQYLVNNRSHLQMSDIDVYGNGTPVTSYINWIVDYEKQVGVDATQNILDLLSQLDVRLVYRLAGFSDKNLLKFYVEKSSANSNNSSLLIPDESYQVLLYDNQPFERIVFSGVVVQITENGYRVYGNSQTNAFFKVSEPINNGDKETLTVENLTVRLAKSYSSKTKIIPYGTEFYSVQEVAQFLSSYGNYLVDLGMKFDHVENGIPVTWNQMVAEFLYWAQIGWEVGNITTLNPAATLLVIDKDSNIVQPLTLRQQNFVLNQNLYPIQAIDLSILREGTAFTAQPLNQGDAISYGQFNIGNIEHGIVFNNVTLFNDVIYNLTTGLRQNRITLRGTKTADWNGTVDAFGFILNQDNITEWNKEVKYTKGSIVKYKNKYWTALTIIQAKEVFDERDWKQTDYNEIQKGLLPNSSTRSYESTLYYDVNKANLENDADQLSFSLIGYRPRDYLALADLTDITQVNVYKNMIKNKGTLDAASAFKGATLPQGGIEYDIYENWAIKSGEFGGVLNSNFVEFKLNESLMTGNPSIVSLTDGVYTDGAQQEVPLYSLFNYGRPINNPDVLPTISTSTPTTLLPTAGYVNFNDVKMSSYFYSGLPTARDASGKLIPISNFYVRDYTWLANYLEEWKVFTPKSLGSIVNVKNNLNGTVTVTFSNAHNLTKYQLFGIVNFDSQVDNYYLVSTVVDQYKVIINLALPPETLNITGLGVGFSMQNQRVATPANIIDLPLLDNEFNKVKVWVDENDDGSWAVYRKSLNYTYNTEITNNTSTTFGSAVAYTTAMNYLIGDSGEGKAYRYTYDTTSSTYVIDQTLSGSTSFGSTITYSDDIFVVSEPTSGSPKVYVYQLVSTTKVNNIEPYQTINAPGGVTNWGSATALSGDKNWLYISDIDNNNVYAYRKNNFNVDAGNFIVGNNYTIVSEGTTDFTLIGSTSNDVGTSFKATGVGTGTGVATDTTYVNQAIINVGSSSGDAFGSSITTDYYGDTVIIGAPYENFDVSTENYGYAYVFNRLVQNFEVQFSGSAYIPQQFILSWTPDNASSKTASAYTGNYLTLDNVTDLSVNDPIIFTGTPFGGVSLNTVYYITDISGNDISFSTTRNGTDFVLSGSSGTMTVVPQTSPLTISVNGTVIADNKYAVDGSTLYIYNNVNSTLKAGDILTVSGSEIVLAQTLDNGLTPRVGVEFGTSIDTNMYASEILVGAPFELNSENVEGAVHRFTNGGDSYGIIIGTSECNITTQQHILLNGYEVQLEPGNADSVAQNINLAKVPNIVASSLNGKIVITLVDSTLAVPNKKLSLTAVNGSTLSELGVNLYTETQTIICPHTNGPTQFGSVVKFNEFGSFVVSAPTAIRYAPTTFDFTDDELDNDTIFDNNTTQFVDSFVNAGAVYMFDYLAIYNESVSNPGAFVYAQSTNDITLDYGSQPLYGKALDFNANRVTIGTPNFRPAYVDGQVVTYVSTSTEPDWAVYRSSSPVVDINGINNIQLFSAETNNTLENLDYIDPLQGKILGAVRENIDVISNVDPASYNSVNATQTGLIWGADKVGQIWFNTTNTRFVNYHQNDVVYNSKYWGRVFPGSDVSVYSWITSNVPPIQYQGPGTPYSTTDYTVQGIVNAEGTIVPVYFYWVRNTNIIFEKEGKTLADSIIQSYIAQPQASGISYFAPLLPNTFGLYNSQEFINANDSVLQIGFKTGENDDVGHSSFSLIRANYADDFLPGIPTSSSISYGHPGTANATIIQTPESLYDRLLDSMCGVDESGAVVPNPFLPKAVQYGVLARPRQSFFINRYGALKNYLEYANTVMALYPITEIRNPVFLDKVGEINPSNGLPFYDTPAYWSYINWWAPGYDNNTKSALQVPIYADLSTLTVNAGTIVSVAQNGNGKQETYISNTDGSWTRIGLENGTIEFSSNLWDYATARLGFGDNFYDTTPYDEYPSQETRDIIRALNEEIYTNELLIYRNKSLILLFEYIQSETIESQNYLPWLNKTSFIDVSHTIRELRPIEVFRSDNQTFLEGYMNEIKPYHVVIKEFLFKYTGTDVYEGDITDFDLPSQYNTTTQTFISPALVFANPSSDNQYLPTDPIWQTGPYNQWFNNYGLSVVGQNNYPIALLTSYMGLTTNVMFVDNANGFPVSGIVTIGTEQISYTSVDLANNALLGLTRGVGETEAQIHIPGEQLITDLPAVLVLNGGRGYTEPPKVTAYIDTTLYPEPRVAAQLEPIMGVDSVIGVNVINPGEGYVVLPEIIIDPSITVTFNSTQVNTLTSTVELDVPLLQTGDLVIYNPTTGSEQIGGLLPGQKYYVNVLETAPDTIIAFYNNYYHSIYDQDRIPLLSTGTGQQQISVGAVASCVTTAVPVRENNITLRFDRTSYSSQLADWAPSGFYGAFYAGDYADDQIFSSSSVRLFSTDPPVGGILAGQVNGITASAQGGTFQILDVANQQTLTWSSRTRNTIQTYGPASLYPNTIRINPSAGGAEVAGQIGSTIGFYVGMPIKFVGAIPVGSPIQPSTSAEDVIYYVKSLVQLPNLDTSELEDTGFTISDTVDENGNPGSTLDLLVSASVPTAGLTLYVGNLTNTALMTINYSGLRNASATSSTNNAVTVDLTVTGQNGTTGFYTGLPILFVGNEFGGIIENKVYYVNAVIDKTSFTMTADNSPKIVTCTATDSATDIISCSSTIGLNVNDPVIFNDMGINGDAVNDFGGIISGTTYYIKEIVSNGSIKLSTTVNGSLFNITSTVTAGNGTFAPMLVQTDVVQLTSATGAMTINVAIPISPGQINGQQFTLYGQSGPYVGVQGTVSELFDRQITSTLAYNNRVCLSTIGGGTTNIYANMEFNVSEDIGGLTTTGGPYTVTGLGTTEINISYVSAVDDWLTVTPTVEYTDTTAALYEGMPLYFTGQSLGGVLLNTVYYVYDIGTGPNAGKIKLSEDVSLSTVFAINGSEGGTMVGTGETYIEVADTLSDEKAISDTTSFLQAEGTPAEFNVASILGGYTVSVTTAGTNYAINNIITISGTDLGGTSPTNDLLLTVLTVDSTGGVLTGIANGTPAGAENKYYLKVVNEDQVEVYSDPNMQIPVSGQNFPYVGATTTTATAIDGSTERITVTSSADFNLNDPVVFTGDVFGDVVLAQTYYILTKPTSTTVTISETIGGSPVNLSTDTGTMTMAKAGDYAVLPQPFYFDSSIVKYNNRVYQCIISNNDSEFIFGKWELLNSGDRRLNALDRIMGYYQPTVNMPGVDLTQLVNGITYPNSTYKGNAFAPADEFTLDTILTDQPFYPTGLNLTSVVWDGTTYISVANTVDYSSILFSEDTNSWVIDRIANEPVAVTSIVEVDGQYIITTNNNATPILTSSDGVTWTDLPALAGKGYSLNKVSYHDGLYIAVGNVILTSLDAITWTKAYEFASGLNNVLYDVSWQNTGFTGFIAVGSGQIYNGSNINDVSIVRYSYDGEVWYDVTIYNETRGFNAIAGNQYGMAVVGNGGLVYTSYNGVTWFLQTNAGSDNLNEVIWDETNSQFVAVGDNGSIQVGDVSGSTWTSETSGTTENLQDVIYNSTAGLYVTVGDNNTVIKSEDAVTWYDSALFEQPPTFYNIQGDAFTAGYGPEELVPGVVTDSVMMTVTTRPGTNWDATVYQNVGYNVVSRELTPTSGSQTEYSFLYQVTTPAQLGVFIIDYTTGLSTSIYEGVDYSVDWINKIVILNNPVTFINETVCDKVRIDVYEVGNGDQLVKANTETDPIRLNTTTGFQEIVTSANYTADIWQGSGVIRPATEPLEAIAIATNSVTDAITCEDVSNFILNGAITFSGEVFGNIVEDQVYYVKSISYVSNRITVSETFNVGTGTPGSTFELSTDTGYMRAIIQIGAGAVWTDPIVYHNGAKLVLGNIATVTRTKSGTNTVTTNTTGNLTVGSPVVFSDTIFGGVIVPQQVYYIETVVDNNEFAISETQYGPRLVLTDATGGASFVTNDYAISLASNGINASIVFSAQYDNSVDYLVYSLFGETVPTQYGYTIPEAQIFVGNGIRAEFALTNFVGAANPDNAIVEIGGVRQTKAKYNIDPLTNSILFYSPPADGAEVVITSYNLTDRQYFSTQYGITGSSGSNLFTLTVGTTTHTVATYDQDTPTAITYDQDTPSVVAFDEELNYLTLSSGDTSGLEINFPIVFQAPTIGGINAGQIYYVIEIIDSTNFVISDQVDGTPFVVYSDTGTMTGVVNGLTVANIVNISNAIEQPSSIAVSDTSSTGNLITCNTTSNLNVGQLITFKTPVVTAGSFTIGLVYQITSLGTTTQLQWNTIAGTVGATYIVGDQFTCANAGTGTGKAELVSVGNINVLGQMYFVRAISSSTEFTIEDQYGSEITLSNSSIAMTGFVGGQPAVRVTTGIPHNLTENALIRIDGTLGSVQLNNQTFYAHVITDNIIDLYQEPYNPALYAVNYPVTAVNSYISGGYVWFDRLFTVTDATATRTTANGNRITVNSTATLVVNTPVFFSAINTVSGDDLMGGILADTEYFVYEVNPEIVADDFIVGNQYEIMSLGDTDWNVVAGTVAQTYNVGDIITVVAIDSGTTGVAEALQEFKISNVRYGYGDVITLTDDTGSINVSQFQQVNVDRLWVTVNGYRVPSSSLRINPYNNLSILTTITTGDEVIITSMMPTATPNEETYLLNVTTTNIPSVFRAETQTRTWLVHPLSSTDDVIYLNDASRITDTTVQEVIAPSAVDGIYSVGLNVDKNAICHITVYNNTTSTMVDPANYYVQVIDLAPILQITDEVSVGDSLTIATTQGRLLFVNGEQIGFNECDLENNTVSELTRGINGTGEQEYIPQYSEVYGLLATNRMSSTLYKDTWNSNIYNVTDGDPLQISQTAGADFLRVDRT